MLTQTRTLPRFQGYCSGRKSELGLLLPNDYLQNFKNHGYLREAQHSNCDTNLACSTYRVHKLLFRVSKSRGREDTHSRHFFYSAQTFWVVEHKTAKLGPQPTYSSPKTVQIGLPYRHNSRIVHSLQVICWVTMP